MINAIARIELGVITLPGATLKAEAARDEQGNAEVWIFVLPAESRRAVTLLHLDLAAWERLHAFVEGIHARLFPPGMVRR